MESTVKMLNGTDRENEYAALYILDSAICHVSKDDAAFDFLTAHHSVMSRAFDAKYAEAAK